MKNFTPRNYKTTISVSRDPNLQNLFGNTSLKRFGFIISVLLLVCNTHNKALATVTASVTPSYTVVCAGSGTTLTASLSGAAATAYAWAPATGLSSTAGASVTASPSATKVYTVTISYSGGTATSTAIVTVNAVPSMSVTGTFCSGIAVTVTPTPSAATIAWGNSSVGTTSVTGGWKVNATTVAGTTGSSGSGSSQLWQPHCTYVTSSGTQYIGDSYNNRVQQWTSGASSGTTVAGFSYGTGSNQCEYPTGVFLDASGNLYIADENNHRIEEYTSGSTSGITVAGVTGSSGGGSNQLNQPNGIYVDAQGNMFIADSYNNRVQEWAPGATSGVTVAGGGGYGTGANQLAYPTAVFVDGSGNLYIADENNERIQKYAPGASSGTTVAGVTGSGGSGSNQLNQPNGIYVDGNGNMYIADSYNNRVQEWAAGATSGTTLEGFSYGSGANQLEYPMGVFLDANGDIYISDENNNRVQEIQDSIGYTYTPTAAGVYTVAVNAFDGCSATQTFTVSSSSPYTLPAITGTTTVCQGSTTNLGDPTSGGTWLSSNTAIATVSTGGVVTGIAAGTATITYRLVTSCSVGTATTTLTVSPLPAAGTISGALALCNAATTTFTATVTGGSWTASNSHATISSTGVVTGVSAGSEIISYTKSNSCGSAYATSKMNINAPPVATVSGSSCAAGTVSLTATPSASSIAWGNASAGITTITAGWRANAVTVAGSTGSSGGGSTQLYQPNGVYVDASGNIYIGDSYNNRVQKWAAGGTSGTTVGGSGGYGTGSSQLAYPIGVYVDGSGNIYTGDENNQRVQEYLSGYSTASTVAGTTSSAGGLSNQLNSPNGIFVDANGNIFIADAYNNRVQEWAAGASSGTTVGGQGGYGSSSNQLAYPTGVYVDASGNLYIADQNNQRIQKYTPGATSGTTVAGVSGTSGSTSSLLNKPVGLYVDGNGTIYIADAYNNRVQQWTAGATSGNTIGGTGGYGTGASQLAYPTSVYLDANGNLYIADENNQRVQEATDTIVNTYVPSLAGTYSVTVTGFNGCSSVQTFSVSSSSPYTLAAITGTTTVCQNATTTLGETATGGTWSSSNSAIASINTSGMVTGITSGTVTITYTVFSSCSVGTATTTVTVSPLPSAGSVSGALAFCSGATTTLTVTATGGSWTASNSHATVSSTGVVTGVSSGTDVISYSVTNSCGSAYATHGITVNALPSASLTGSLCSGLPLTMSATPSPYSIAWGNGSVGTTTVTAGWHLSGVTVAGVTGSSGGGSTQLNTPSGVYVDASGNVYIADSYNNRIQEWAPGATSGTTVGGAGGYGSGSNQLAYPTGVFLDASGNMYIADQNNNRIMKYTSGATSGTMVAGAGGSGSASNQLSSPNGVYVDGNGNVYISDPGNNRIEEYTAGATSGVIVAGNGTSGTGASQLNGPSGVYVDGIGNIFVADKNNHRIQKWAPGATSGTTVAGGTCCAGGSGASQLKYPDGICVDGLGSIYIADNNNQRIQMWTSGASSGTTVGGGSYGTGSAQLEYPTGNFTDINGNVYTGDNVNSRIQEYQDTIVNTYVPSAAGSYSVIVTGFNGCSTAQTFSVSSSAPYSLAAITGTTTVCQNATTTLGETATGGSWSSSNSAIATVNTGGVVTGIATGTVTVAYTAYTGCSIGTASATVTVNPLPSAGSISGALAFCSGATTTLTVTATGGNWTASNSHATVSSTGVVTGVSSGTDVISYSVTNSCGTAYTTHGITVNALPSASLTGSLCSGLPLTMSATPSPYSIAWGNASVGTTTATAGWQTNGITVAGITGSSGGGASQLNTPSGVYVDGSGNVYIADPYNNRIQEWAPGATSGTTVGGAGGYGSGTNQLAYPTGVFLDASGNMYIADQNNNRIMKYTSGATSGIVVAGAGGSGSASNQLSGPNGVYVDVNGNIYISDAGNNRIEEYTAGATTGVIVAGTGTSGTGATQLNGPSGVYVDGSGNIFVADKNNHRIQKWAPGATSGTTVAGGTCCAGGSGASQLKYPDGIYVDGLGSIYIADNNNQRIQMWTSGAGSGITVGGSGGYGSGASQLEYPTGNFTDINGNVYTGDNVNSRIQEFKDTIINTYVPLGTGSYSVIVTGFNGCSTAQTFSVSSSAPYSLAAITGTTTVCQNATTTLSETATGGTWSSGNSAIATVNTGGVVTGIATGTVAVAYTAITGCSVGSASTTATVNPLPSAGTVSGTLAFCSGATTTLSVTATGGSWTASNSHATVSSTGVVTGVSSGTDVISYAVTNSCGTAYATHGITVNALPSASLTGNLCSGSALTMSVVPSAYSIAWGNSSVGTTTATAGWQVSGITVAGVTGSSGSGASQLNTPSGVYVDASGNIYIADPYNNRIQKWAPGATSGTTVGGAGGYGTGTNQLAYPTGVYLDASGNMYIADQNNNRIMKYTSGATSGTVVAGAGGYGSGSNQLSGPNGVYADVNGNIYISDAGNNRIEEYIAGATSGVIVAGTGTSGTGANQLNGPSGVYVDGSGNIYVADKSNHRIQKWAPGASSGTTVAGGTCCAGGSGASQLKYPDGICVDGLGDIYIADNNNQRIQMWTPGAGSGITVGGGSYGTGSAQLEYPTGNYTDINGNVYTGDNVNSRIQEYKDTIVNTYVPSASGTYSVTVTTFNGCSTAQTFTVLTTPVAAAITGTTTLCQGGTVSLSDATSGGTWGSSNTAIATLSSSGIASGIGTGTVNATYAVTNTCGTATAISMLAIGNTNQWTGAASTSWNGTTNWTCGFVPVATQDVVIPGASFYSFAPTLNVTTGYTHNLTLNATAALTLGSGNQLDVAGNMTNNATISGAGIVYLDGSSAQTLSGNGLVSNLTLNNSIGATISTVGVDTVGITGTLLLNTGTLITNNKLMLVSNSSGNGTIGTITGGAISGNTIVQQYVQGGRRAYRFVAHPFTSSIALSQVEPYIDITGAGGATNGFTTTTSNAPSAYWYNTQYGNSSLGTDPGWRAYTSTYGSPDSNNVHRYQGLRLFIRGSKGEGLTGASYTPDALTYRTYGPVNTGTQTVTMTKGTGANADYNLLGNPYPAVTDIGTVIATASAAGKIAGAAFYVWDPYFSTSGQFVTIAISGGHYYMGPNESFEVRTAANGNALSFAESNKSTTVTADLMRSTANDFLTLYVYDSSYHPWDMLYLSFDDAATDNEDTKYDGTKPPSPAALNFYSLSADNKKLSLDARPYNAGKAIPLGISSSYAQQFIIKADNVAAVAGREVYLHDKYLGTYTLLQQGTEYKFNITQDNATQGENRFELRMGNGNDNSANAGALEVQMVPNPATSIVNISYTATSKQQTSIRVINVAGVTVMTKDMGVTQSGNIQLSFDNLASGIYMVELTSGTDKVVQRLVKE